MHFVVDDVTGRAEINGVDDFVVAVFFVSVEIFGLTAVTCRRLNRRTFTM